MCCSFFCTTKCFPSCCAGPRGPTLNWISLNKVCRALPHKAMAAIFWEFATNFINGILPFWRRRLTCINTCRRGRVLHNVLLWNEMHPGCSLTVEWNFCVVWLCRHFGKSWSSSRCCQFLIIFFPPLTVWGKRIINLRAHSFFCLRVTFTDGGAWISTSAQRVGLRPRAATHGYRHQGRSRQSVSFHKVDLMHPSSSRRGR